MKSFKDWKESIGLEERAFTYATVKAQLHIMSEYVEYMKEFDNQWKTLDIDDLPKRFFTRNDIEIQDQIGDHGEYETISDKIERIMIINNLIESGIKHRYRIIDNYKPTQTISCDMESFGRMILQSRRLIKNEL